MNQVLWNGQLHIDRLRVSIIRILILDSLEVMVTVWIRITHYLRNIFFLAVAVTPGWMRRNFMPSSGTWCSVRIALYSFTVKGLYNSGRSSVMSSGGTLRGAALSTP